MPSDLTLLAVTRQLDAMNCSSYQIGLRSTIKGRMWNQPAWTREHILKGIPWLSRQNARGEDVYIRPWPETPHSLILLDDVTPDIIAALTASGYAPACEIETSPGNYQAWVNLGEPMSREARTEAARLLQRRFGGDPASADGLHYGRLAGFTNRKPKYQQPYVKIWGHSGQVAAAAASLRAEAEVAARQARTALESENVIITNISSCQNASSVLEAFTALWGQWHDWVQKQGWTPDLSRGDFWVAKRLLEQGFSPDAVATAIARVSPDIQARKGQNVQQYAERTVRAAYPSCRNTPEPGPREEEHTPPMP